MNDPIYMWLLSSMAGRAATDIKEMAVLSFNRRK